MEVKVSVLQTDRTYYYRDTVSEAITARLGENSKRLPCPRSIRNDRIWVRSQKRALKLR